jgi:hypothetical protein
MRRRFAGSASGPGNGEMLSVCAERKMGPAVENYPDPERMLKSDVKYRFSIDMS